MDEGKKIYDQGMDRTHLEMCVLFSGKLPWESLPLMLCVPWKITKESRALLPSLLSLDVASHAKLKKAISQPHSRQWACHT